MKQTSGIPTPPAFIEGGLELDDSVVWLTTKRGDLGSVLDAFLAPPPGEVALPGNAVRRTICLGTSPDCGHPVGSDEEFILHPVGGDRRHANDLVSDDLVARFGAEATVESCRRMCPRLFELAEPSPIGSEVATWSEPWSPKVSPACRSVCSNCATVGYVCSNQRVDPSGCKVRWWTWTSQGCPGGLACAPGGPEGGENRGVPMTTRGTELVLCTEGLVMVDLGETTPVLRAHDALMVTEESVLSFTNLAGGQAGVFWVAL